MICAKAGTSIIMFTINIESKENNIRYCHFISILFKMNVENVIRNLHFFAPPTSCLPGRHCSDRRRLETLPNATTIPF